MLKHLMSLSVASSLDQKILSISAKKCNRISSRTFSVDISAIIRIKFLCFTSKVSTQWKTQSSIAVSNHAEGKTISPELLSTRGRREAFTRDDVMCPQNLHTPRNTLFSPAAYTHPKPQQINIKGHISNIIT